MFIPHAEGLNFETFDKDMDYFEILIESKTNLRITYKDNDQFDNLLVFMLSRYIKNIYLFILVKKRTLTYISFHSFYCYNMYKFYYDYEH